MAKFTETKAYWFWKFCKTYEKFEIPKFQRPYSWKNKQLQDFFSSILENEEDYFIWNIISVLPIDNVNNIENFSLQIIDGQQRLTTLFLLLSVIKKQLSDLPEKEGINIKWKIARIDNILFWKDAEDFSDDIWETKLTFNKQSYTDLFKTILLNELNDDIEKQSSDIEKRLISNFYILNKLIKDHIQWWDDFENLNLLLTKIMKLQFIFIWVSTDSDIYWIFEWFNATWLGLSVADLIKNSILNNTKQDKNIQDSVTFLWDEMEDLFSSTTSLNKFPKFIRYQWISKNWYISLSNLYSEINKIKIKWHNQDDILNFITELNEDSKIYLWIMYEKHEKFLDIPKNLISHFSDFRYLRNDQVYEVLLSYYRLYKNGLVKEWTLIKNLKKLWIFVVRSRFVSINPSDYEKKFAKHCEILSDANKESINSYLDWFISEIKKLVSDDKQFITNIVSDVRYNDSDKKLIKKIFLAIFEKENSTISINEPEIEHILPQKPVKWWLTEREIKTHINMIWNLTLLFSWDNKKVGNEKMDIKSTNYANSAFDFNKDLSLKWKDEFNNDYQTAIDNKSIIIADKISKIWKI